MTNTNNNRKSEFKLADKKIVRDILWLVGLFLLVKIYSIALIPVILSGIKKATPKMKKAPIVYGMLKAVRNMGEAGKIIMPALTVLIYATVIVIAFLIYRAHAPKVEYNRFKHFFRIPTAKEVGIYFLTLGCMYCANIVTGIANHLIYGQTTTANNQVAEKLLNLGGSTTTLLIFAVVLFAPITEELIFRGSFINVFFNKSGKFFSPSVIISGAIFSSFHLSTNIVSFLTYMLAGMFLAYSYEKTDSLKVSMSVHFTNNAIAVIAMLALLK